MRHPNLCMLAAIFVETLVSSTFSKAQEALSGVPAEEVVAYLHSEEQKFFGKPFKASYALELPVNELDTDQGKVVKATLVSQADSDIVIKVSCEYPPPVYKPLGSKGYHPKSYDEQGNLYFARKTREFIYCNPIENKQCAEMEMLLVDKDGAIIERGFSWRLDRYPPDIRDPLNEFDVFCLATGRGYGSCCSVVDEHQTLLNGEVRLKGTGRYMNTLMKGKWELILDGKRNYPLISRASLISSPDGEPTIAISCLHPTLFGDTRLMERAFLSYRPFDENVPYEVALLIQQYVEEPNLELFDEVKTQISQPLPQGRSVIFDHRAGGDPVISHPGRSFVKCVPLHSQCSSRAINVLCL